MWYSSPTTSKVPSVGIYVVQCGSILKDLNHNPPNFQEGTLFILLLFFIVSLNQMHGATVFRNVFHSCFSNQGKKQNPMRQLLSGSWGWTKTIHSSNVTSKIITKKRWRQCKAIFFKLVKENGKMSIDRFCRQFSEPHCRFCLSTAFWKSSYAFFLKKKQTKKNQLVCWN